MDDISKMISVWAYEFGNTDPTMVLILAILGFLLLLIVVIALRTTIQRNQESDRTAAIIARVEKLEGNLTQFRDDMTRMMQQFRAVTESVRSEVDRVRKDIDNGGSGGDGGSSPAGGGSSGGSSGGNTGGGLRQGSAALGASSAATTLQEETSAQGEVTTPTTKAVEALVIERKSSIATGLTKTRRSFLGKLKAIFTGAPTIDTATLDELEETLITADVGVQCTTAILEKVRAASQESKTLGEGELQRLVKDEISRSLLQLPSDHKLYAPVGAPMIVLVVGVNGVGKTTTTAKLAARWKNEGKKVLLVAADTFRAAAVQQLQEWGRRLDVTVISGAENAKPSTVVFDGMAAAKSSGADVVVIDTAGRLHTKSNLMQELEGVRNAILKHFPQGPDETLLVLDGVSGQNALHQAREFNAAVALSGVVVTKLDGTPKGGIVVAIARELKLPVAYVGVGEKAEDLLPFSVEEFVEGLFDESEMSSGKSVPPSLRTVAATSAVISTPMH